MEVVLSLGSGHGLGGARAGPLGAAAARLRRRHRRCRVRAPRTACSRPTLSSWSACS
nr:hypothetical protein [Aquabacterium terrae]